MLVYQKAMFDRYYCIKSFYRLKTLENALKKIIYVFPIYNYGAQKHEGFVGFKNACSKVKTYAIMTFLNYVHF